MVVNGFTGSRTDLRRVVQPRFDVLSGALTDSIFAASLDEVVAGTAPTVYQDPQDFFANTHPSVGMRDMFREVFGRLSGQHPDAPPIIRLETNLGGGKTHNLIALYHAARGGLAARTAAEFVDPQMLGQAVRIGVFVGTSAGATSFPVTNGVCPHTVWGYLALQLGGRAAYAVVAAEDETKTAPGSAALSRVLGDDPTLILVDELAPYLAKAEGVGVGTGNLAVQTLSFLASLLEAVSGLERAVLVLTNTQTVDVFGEQTTRLLRAVEDANQLIVRKAHMLRPSNEADLPAILARRLFERCDRTVAAGTAAAYSEAARRALDVDLPQTTQADWVGTAERAWPFHPDLITVLDKRLSTMPNFNRTRGALRLLARTVRRLWEHPVDAAMIHLHHIDLADRDIVEELTSRIDRAAFGPVIGADIVGQPGHADQIDLAMSAAAPYARRLATALYLWSLTQDTPGVPAGTLIGSVLTPQDDPNVVSKALDELTNQAWYLSDDAQGFRFSTEPNLQMLIHDAEQRTTTTDVYRETGKLLLSQYRDTGPLTVRRVWEGEKVPDQDDKVWLVLLHWDQFGQDRGVTNPDQLPSLVRDIWERTPTGGLRAYLNRLVFLVPSAGTHEPMVRAVRRWRALAQLQSTEIVRSLPGSKIQELADKTKEARLGALVAVCNHFNVLYVPQSGGLRAYVLDTVHTSNAEKNQAEAIFEYLRQQNKIFDVRLDPAQVASQLGAQLAGPLSTVELVRAFARQPGMRIVVDLGRVRELIIDGVRNGIWEYQDPELPRGQWATQQSVAESPAFPVHIDADTFLCPLGTAPVPQPDPDPVVIDNGGRPLPPTPPSPIEFVCRGAAAVAIHDALLQAADRHADSITSIRISIDEPGDNPRGALARLLSVVPPSTSRAELRYQVDLDADLGQPGTDRLTVRFIGPARAYEPVKAGLDEVLRTQQAVVRASVTARFEPPISLASQQIQSITQAATDSGPADCTVNIVPTQEQP
jgi:hypothetical protein